LNAEPLFTLRGRLEPGDLFRFSCWFLFMRSPGAKLVFWVCVLIALAWPLAWLHPATRDLSWPERIFGLLLPLIWIGVIPLALLASSRKRARRHPNLQGELVIRVFRDAVEMELPTGVSRHEWGDYYRAVESRSFFALFLRANQIHLIPKRFFEGGAQQGQFRELIRGVAPVQRA
jgi:hypothetical protein